MTRKENCFEPGEIILSTAGEYSDYRHIEILVAVKKLNLQELIKEHKQTYKPEHKWDTPDPESFTAWLVVNEYAMPVKHTEVHLGTYGELKR